MKTEQQLQLCSFEQAKRLKKLNFDWETGNMFYDGIGTLSKCLYLSNRAINGGMINAPTVALALKWARDVKEVRYEMQAVKGGWEGVLHDDDYVICTSPRKTYEQTESVLLNTIIKFLETQKQ
jgi:hypothetical protein